VFGESTGRGARDAVCPWSASHRKLLFCVSFWSHHVMPLANWQCACCAAGRPPPRVCIGCLVGLLLPLPPLSSREVRLVDQSKATSFPTSSPRLIVHPPRHPHTSHTHSSGHLLPSPSAPCHVQVPIFSSVTLSLIPPPPFFHHTGSRSKSWPSFPHRNALHSFSRMPHRKMKQNVLSALAPAAPKQPPPPLETLLAPPPLANPHIHAQSWLLSHTTTPFILPRMLKAGRFGEERNAAPRVLYPLAPWP